MMMDDSNDVLGMSIRGEFPQEKVFINEDHPTQILNQLSTLWRDKKFCDASLEVGPVKVFVHRLLLVSACPYLLTIGGQHEAAMLEVRLPMSVGLEGLNIFLTYLYEGVLNLTLSNLESVERLAKALKVEAVISFCDQFRAMAGKPAYVPSKQYDYSLHMTATSLQLNFTEVPLTLSNTVKKETEESSSPSRKRPRNAQVLQESAKGTPNKSTPAKGTEKGPTATREKETRKAAQRSLNLIRSIQQDEAIESQVCIKQEPSSDTEDDSESQGIEPRTDFVQNAAILSLACLNDADSSKSDLNVTDPGLTSTLQNVGEGTDSSLEMLCLDDDTQPRMFLHIGDKDAPTGLQSNQMQFTLTMGNLHTTSDPVNVSCNMSITPSKSSVEWTTKYREKLRQDPMAWENYKRREAERKRESRKKMTDEQRKLENERTRLRRKRRILNLALANMDVSSLTSLETPGTGNTLCLSGTEGNQNPENMLPQNLATIFEDPSRVEGIVMEKQREFWRQKKREYRARMSEEKKQAMRQNDAQRKREIRAAFKGSSTYWHDQMGVEGAFPLSDSFVGGIDAAHRPWGTIATENFATSEQELPSTSTEINPDLP